MGGFLGFKTGKFSKVFQHNVAKYVPHVKAKSSLDKSVSTVNFASAVFLAPKNDTRTAAGRLVLNVLMSVAQWERETIGERTKDALQHKIRNGERCGKVRFGFRLADDGVALIEDPAEQGVLQTIRRLKAAGQSLREIAAELTRRGILTKEGNRTWKHTTVARILQRTV
jgi:DNA invertase Pin-like site-specific DNA recombinase